ncbi:MAG: M48 family metalloprotease, partial [Verrucomicrobiales bacterium]|nr:M48 family metalloprotease [Verrucomicrobiales bacterium]
IEPGPVSEIPATAGVLEIEIAPATAGEAITTGTTVEVADQPAAMPEKAVAGTRWEFWVVAIWLCGVGFFGLRFFLDWRAMRRLQFSAHPLADAEWRQRIAGLSARIGITRGVRLLSSAAIRVPMVIGVLRPVVIVPPSLISGLSPTEVDAILLHELAHIRRHDFLVNLLQSVVETVFFFHPAIWWISNRIREEREHCCDDLATAACGDVGQYARALTALEETRLSSETGGLAVAADGRKRGSLIGRIRRLVRGEKSMPTGPGWPLAMLGGLAILAAVSTIFLVGADSALAAEDEEKKEKKIATKIDMKKLRVSQFGGQEREIFAIHSEEEIYAVFVLQPPKGWKSNSSSAGVRVNPNNKKSGVAWADYKWDDTELRIRFDTQKPKELQINEQTLLMQRGGRVVHWRGPDEGAENTSVLAADAVPEPRATDVELKKFLTDLRERIIAEFSPDDDTLIAPRKPGKWELGDGVTFELEQNIVHGADVMTNGIIRWPKSEKWPALRYEFNVAADAFANRDPWALALDKNKPRHVFLAKGDQHYVSINFENPEQIIRDWTNTGFSKHATPAVIAAIEKHFRIGKKPENDGIQPIGGNMISQEIESASIDEEFVVKGKVYDGKNGGPMAGVLVQAFSEYKPLKRLAAARSGDDGTWELRFRVELETLKNFRGLRVEPGLAGFFDRDLFGRGEFNMMLSKDETIPETVVSDERTGIIPGEPAENTEFRMSPGARVTGKLVDSEGKPMVGAYIAVRVIESEGDLPWTGPRLQRPGFRADSTATDDDGRFVLDQVPTNRRLNIEAAKRPTFEGMTEDYEFKRDTEVLLRAGWELKAEFPEDVDPSAKTQVRVISEQEEIPGPKDPVAFAKTVLAWAKTAAENRTGEVVEPQTWNHLMGWGNLIEVKYRPDFPEKDRVIEALKTDSPVIEIAFLPNHGGPDAIYLKTADQKVHALAKWDSKALAEVVREPSLNLSEISFYQTLLTAVDTAAVPEAKGRRVQVRGKMVDAVTGEPVKKAKVIQAGRFDPLDPDKETQWGFSETRSSAVSDQFSTSVNWPKGWTARIIVDGYQPAPILTKAPDADATKIDVIVKLEKSPEISGRVLDHNGNPVEGASIFSVPPTGINVAQGRATKTYEPYDDDPSFTPVKTDADGKFTGISIGGTGKIVVTAKSFDAWPVIVPEGKKNVEIKLPEPIAFEFDYDIPGAEDKIDIFYQYLSPWNVGGELQELWKHVDTRRPVSIQKGQVTVTGFVPGHYQLARTKPVSMKQIGHNVWMELEFFEVEAGSTRKFDWNRSEGPGAVVTGKVKWPEKLELMGISWRIESQDSIKDNQGRDKNQNYDGGLVDLESGNFKSVKLPPGKFTLILSAQKPIPQERMMRSGIIGPDGVKSVEVEVPENGQVDLGTIEWKDLK